MTGDGRLERAPPSPCLGICLMDPATRQCRGCLRTIEEIAGWLDASVAEKHALIAVLAARRAALGEGRNV
jgi:uncharacterized protein